MRFTGSAIAKLANGDRALLGFDTNTTDSNHLLHAEVTSSFLVSQPENRDSPTMMLVLKQRDGTKSFASYVEGSGEDVLNAANGLMLKGANVIKAFPSLQDGLTWLKDYAVLYDIYKPFESMVAALNKHTNMSPDAMNKITIGELAEFDPSKNPRFSYIGDDEFYVNNVRTSAAATHDDFLEDQVNNGEVSLVTNPCCSCHFFPIPPVPSKAPAPSSEATATISADVVAFHVAFRVNDDDDAAAADDDDDDDAPPPLISRADATESDDVIIIDDDDGPPLIPRAMAMAIAGLDDVLDRAPCDVPLPNNDVPNRAPCDVPLPNSESCNDHDDTNTLTVTISAAPTNVSGSYFANGSVPDFDPSPSARVNRHVNVIVHNIVNGRVDVASDLYIKYNDTFSDEAKQIIFQHVRHSVDEEFGLSKEMVPICFPGYFDVWWTNGDDVPPPMETPKTQDDGGGKPRANDPMVWETSEMKEAPDRACFTDFSSIERRQSHFQDEDSF